MVITGNKYGDINKAMEIVEEWTILADMKINKKKSGIMKLRRRRKSEEGIRKHKEHSPQI